MSKARLPPGSLSPERVAEAALTVVADHGLDALTMRAVADRLGASPMALYRHVADRDELVDRTVDEAMADLPLAEHPAPAEAAAWLVSMADVLRDRLRRYPGTAGHLFLHGPTGPHAVWFMDRVCHVLEDTGRGPAQVAEAYDWLMSTIAVYILKQDRLDERGGTPRVATEFQERTRAYSRRLPHVRAVIPEFTGDADAAFARVVRAVVDAIVGAEGGR